MSKHKILFATDVPFWRTSDGAEQRIASLHRFFSAGPYEAKVFFLGRVDAGQRRRLDELHVDVIESTSDQPPEKLSSRIRWYADATIHQARSWLNRDQDRVKPADGPASLTLKDFDWPWARRQFTEAVENFQPDTIIFEYIKTGYLLDALSSEQRKKIRCVIDTHDVLHRRAEQFFAHGFPHWLKITRDEEAACLQQFDVVAAIQDREAELFREMAPNATTVTVGHAVDAEQLAIPDSFGESPKKLKIGYIGSKNFSNWQAIRNFLQHAWPSVIEKNGEICELVVAGAICDWFDSEKGNSSNPELSEVSTAVEARTLTRTNVNLIGRVDDVMKFYDQIDVLINPVEFGTGLKIKNAEALRYGKLLITTRNGFDGMPEATRLACKVVEDVNEMGMAINSLCRELPAIRQLQSLALQLSQTEFSEHQAYSALHRLLIND